MTVDSKTKRDRVIKPTLDEEYIYWNHMPYFFADHAYPNDQIACIYRQMDGYPSDHGKELAEFLKNIEIVNGIVLNMAAGSHANGIECLAAQTVAYLKDKYGIGMIYLQTPNQTQR